MMNGTAAEYAWILEVLLDSAPICVNSWLNTATMVGSASQSSVTAPPTAAYAARRCRRGQVGSSASASATAVSTAERDTVMGMARAMARTCSQRRTRAPGGAYLA